MKDKLPLITLIAGSLASIFALSFDYDEKLIYSIIVLTLLLLLAVTYLFRQDDKSKGTKGFDYQPNLWSFLKNELNQDLTKDDKKYLIAESQLLIIGFNESQTNEVKSQIESEFSELSESIDIRNFLLETDKNQADLKSRLKSKLKVSNAIILVRTYDLELNSWVYDLIESWAANNSHAPCLVIDLMSEEQIKSLTKSNQYNKIPNYYYYITPNPISSIPWRLLKRANDRSLSWRKQASYNRMFAMVFLGFLLPLSTLAVLAFQNSKKNLTESQMYPSHEARLLGSLSPI